ncbi:MAG: histidine kinase [Bacteroidota bacterium]
MTDRRNSYIWMAIGLSLLLLAEWWLWQSELERIVKVALGWIGVVLALLVSMHYLISRRLDQRLPWTEAMSRRFWVQLWAETGLALLIINLTYFIFRKGLLDVTPDANDMLVLNVYGLLFLVPLISFNTVLFSISQWRRSMLFSEQLKQDHIRSQLESLRNHLDPHFLFNNLNILSALIDRNQDAAQDFLADFAEVYRYVLKHKSESLVQLKTELEAMDAYIHMLRLRFPRQLQIEVDIAPGAKKQYLPPLALQLLLENAIKHNKASPEQPLHISIFGEPGQLIVENTYRPLEHLQQTTGTGLDNLAQRYTHLSAPVPEITQNDAIFRVSLQLLPNA